MLRVIVVAHPGSRREHVERLGHEFAVWVRARPVDGQANVAIERALARVLGLRPRQVRIASGATSKRKIVELDLHDQSEFDARLLAHAVRD
jgi:uncharacterized protein YggU (UPF0235/DUF167 family)